MLSWVNTFLDRLSDFIAHRKGLLPLVGLLLIIVNLILKFYPGSGWLVETDLLLHTGLIITIIGFLLAWAL
jgi:hypothetical protein